MIRPARNVCVNHGSAQSTRGPSPFACHLRLKRFSRQAISCAEPRDRNGKLTDSSSKQRNQNSAGLWPGIISGISDLRNEQKAYLAIICIIAAVAIPRLLLVAVVGLERVLVGGLLVAEQGIVAALRTISSLLAVVGAVALAVLTITSFLKPKKR